jgi:hypothetical protein
MGFLSSLFGVKDRTPATSTNVVSQKLPAEIAPAVTRAVDEATAIFEAEKARGYDPYTGETIAPFTPEEQQAMAGIAGLVGTATPLVQESLETYRTGAEKFTPETAQEYMSPYQRAVTDIEKREAGRQFDVAQQVRDAQAAEAGAGSLMGTRSAILEAEAARNQQQLLSDIEARGLQSAFTNAQQQFAAQKARERQMAGDVARTGTGLLQAELAEQGALQTVGEQKRQLGQSALDEAYARFLEERNFPQQNLADFTQTIYGNPLSRMPTSTTTRSALPGAASPAQQALGLGLSGLNIFGMGGGFDGGFSMKNLFKAKGGPLIEAQSGIGPIVIGGSQVPDRKSLEYQARFGNLQERREAIKKLGGPDSSKRRLGGLGPLKPFPKRLFNLNPTERASKSPLNPVKTNLALQADRDTSKKWTMSDDQRRSQIRRGGLSSIVSEGDTGAFALTGQGIPESAIQEENLLSGFALTGQGIPGTEKPNLVASTSTDPRLTSTLKGLQEMLLGQATDRLGRKPIGERITAEEIKLRRENPELYDAKKVRERMQRELGQETALAESQLKEREGMRTDFAKENREALDSYREKQEKLVKDLGGYPGDILGDALDQGMNEPTIATMLGKIMNVSAKGLGKRRKEINEKLSDINKLMFDEEKELRKGEQTNKLSGIQEKQKIAANSLLKKFGIDKAVRALPETLRNQVMTRIKDAAVLEKSDITSTAALIKSITDIIDATTPDATGNSGKSMVSFIDRIEKDVARSKGFMISEDGEIMIDKNTPLTKTQRDAMNVEVNDFKQKFSDRLSRLDPSMSSYSAMNMAYADIIPQGGRQTGSGRPQGVPSNAQQGTYQGQTIWIVDKKTAYDSTGKLIKIK